MRQLGSKAYRLKNKLSGEETIPAERQELLSLVEEAERLKERMVAVVDEKAEKRLEEDRLFKSFVNREEKKFKGIEKLSDEEIARKFFFSNFGTTEKKDISHSLREIAKSGDLLAAAFNIKKGFDSVMNELIPSQSSGVDEMSWIYRNLAETNLKNKGVVSSDWMKDKKIQQEILDKRLGVEVYQLMKGEAGGTIKVSSGVYLDQLNKKHWSYKKIKTLVDGIKDFKYAFKDFGELIKENLASKSKEQDKNVELRTSVGSFFDNLSGFKKELSESEIKKSTVRIKNAPEGFKFSKVLKEWQARHPKLGVQVDEKKIWAVMYGETEKDLKQEIENIQNKEIEHFGLILKGNLESIINKVGEDKPARKAIRSQVVDGLNGLLETNLAMEKKSLIHIVIDRLSKKI